MLFESSNAGHTSIIPSFFRDLINYTAGILPIVAIFLLLEGMGVSYKCIGHVTACNYMYACSCG